jgi:EmrB/QacA subfamily drug resistance transporter
VRIAASAVRSVTGRATHGAPEVVVELRERLGTAREHSGLRLGLLSLAQFILVVDGTIVMVSLPTIAREMHFNSSNLQWLITFYGLTFGGFLMVGGRAGDLLGRRRTFVFGIATFAFMSAMCGLAQSSTMLIICRAGQGLGGALASPAALSLLTGTFAEGRERNVALGVWSAVASAGATTGNTLGGIITSTIGWRWIFLVNVPICALVIVGALVLLPRVQPEGRPRLDIPGAITVTAGLGLLILAASQIEEHGLANPSAIVMSLGSVALIGLFIRREANYSAPLLPFAIFRRSLVVGNCLLVLAAITGSATYFFTSLFLQQVRGHSAIWTGFAFAPWAAIIAVSSIVASRSNVRFGGRRIAAIGFVIVALGAGLIAAAVTGGSSYLEILPGFLIMGIGGGITGVTNTIAAMAGVPKDDQGIAAGITNSAQRLGSSIGLAILATVATGRINHLVASGSSAENAQISGYQLGILVVAALAVLGAVGALVFIRDRSTAEDDEELGAEVIVEAVETV